MMPAAAPAGTYQPRWGDLVRYGDEAAAGDEPPLLVVGLLARGSEQLARLREHDGRLGTFRVRNLTMVERPPLPPALESEEQFVDVFRRDSADIPPGRSVLPGRLLHRRVRGRPGVRGPGGGRPVV